MSTGQQSEQSVLRSQDFYRLKRAVVSPGDIYEIDVSSKAIYIGPDSDIAEVQVQYFDPSAPGAVQTAVVAVNGPFVGRLDALLKTQIPQTGQPARLLVSPVDIVDNAYAYPLNNALRSFNIPAQIDLMIATGELPDIPAVRADRTFRFPMVPYETGRSAPPDNGSTDIFIPIYGRRMVTISAVSSTEAQINCSLVNLGPGGVQSRPRYIGTIYVPTTIPASPGTGSFVYRASDAMRQGQIYDDEGTPTGIYQESDAGTTPDVLAFGGTPIVSPQVRGMADLLYLNIKDYSGTMAEQTQYVDLFIKISDRED